MPFPAEVLFLLQMIFGMLSQPYYGYGRKFHNLCQVSSSFTFFFSQTMCKFYNTPVSMGIPPPPLTSVSKHEFVGVCRETLRTIYQLRMYQESHCLFSFEREITEHKIHHQ